MSRTMIGRDGSLIHADLPGRKAPMAHRGAWQSPVEPAIQTACRTDWTGRVAHDGGSTQPPTGRLTTSSASARTKWPMWYACRQATAIREASTPRASLAAAGARMTAIIASPQRAIISILHEPSEIGRNILSAELDSTVDCKMNWYCIVHVLVRINIKL